MCLERLLVGLDRAVHLIHRAGQISAFDFFPVTIQAGLFLSSTRLLPGSREVCESLRELLSAL